MKNIIIAIAAIVLFANIIYFIIGLGSEPKICKEVYRAANIDKEDLTCEYICDFTEQIGKNVHKAVLAQKMVMCYKETHQEPCNCGEAP